MNTGATNSILFLDQHVNPSSPVFQSLRDQFDINLCSSTDQALEFCKQHPPQIIIIDVDDNENLGLGAVSALRETCPQSPSILCLANDPNLETRLSIYQSGGDDCIAKPFEIGELSARVERFDQYQRHQQALIADKQLATQAVVSAMTEASQYGGVLRFFNKMYNASDEESMSRYFFDLMEEFNLNASIQFRLTETKTFDYCQEEVREIEQQIYENLYEKGKLISFSSRLMVNGRWISFIVKNMPTDEVSAGRYRDILSTVIDGLDAKAVDLQRLKLLRQTSMEVAASSQRLSDVLENQEKVLIGAMNHVISELTASFDILELNELQEEFFTGLTENILNRVEESFIHIGNEQEVLNCLWLSLHTVLGQGSTTQ